MHRQRAMHRRTHWFLILLVACKRHPADSEATAGSSAGSSAGSGEHAAAATPAFSAAAIGEAFAELSPRIAQTFFIGDGRTPGGATQRFLVPGGARDRNVALRVRSEDQADAAMAFGLAGYTKDWV